MDNLTDLAKKAFVGDEGFISANNYKIVKVEENYCELEGTLTKSSLNPYGIVHGGYIFGLADTAAGIACRTTGRMGVTTTSSIEYLKSGRGDKLKAIAKCLKDGKSIAFYEVLIYDGEDTLIARSSMTYYYIENNHN